MSGVGTIYKVTYGNGLFAAVGDHVIATSTDGVAWTQHSAPQLMDSVTFSAGQFVSVGDNGAVLISPNGIIWTPETSGVNTNLYDVTYGNGKFVAVGVGGTIVTKPATLSNNANLAGMSIALSVSLSPS